MSDETGPVCIGGPRENHRPTETYRTDKEPPTGYGTVYRCSTCRREVIPNP